MGIAWRSEDTLPRARVKVHSQDVAIGTLEGRIDVQKSLHEIRTVGDLRDLLKRVAKYGDVVAV